MRIQHNISALNSWRQLGINQSNSAKNLEKLSSGYRINRAGDDAAGLAISEKMRAQIRGLDMATKNAQDGISLIQTAEGALNETHAILQRMRELAVQSANGTYQDEDRQNTDLEIQALKDELDRIAQSTTFNKINLLDGSKAANYSGDGGTALNFNINAAFGEGESITIGDKTFTFGGENGIKGKTAEEQATNLAQAINDAGMDDVKAEAEGKTVKLTSKGGYTFTTPTTAGKMGASEAITLSDTQAAGHMLTTTFTAANEDTANAANFKEGDTITALDGKTYTFGSGEGQVAVGKDFDTSMANLTAALNANNAGVFYDAGKGKTDVAVGNWTYENQTNTLSFVANDADQDFAAHAPNKAMAINTTPGVIGGITTSDGTSSARLDSSTYNVTAEQLKSGATFQIGKEEYTISNDADFAARLNDLAEQINNNATSAVTASVADNKLQLTTKAAGETIGDVKIVNDATYATATAKITTALELGETITADGQTYTAKDLGADAGADAIAQMRNLVNLINKNPERTVVATYNDTDNIIELRNAEKGNGNIAKIEASNGNVQLEGVTIPPTEVVPGAPTAAAVTFDFSAISGEFTNGETIDFNGEKIEFASTVTDATSQVQLGANMTQTISNLAAFLNGRNGTGQAGEVLDDANAPITGTWTSSGTTLKFEANAVADDQVIEDGLAFTNYSGAQVHSFQKGKITATASNGNGTDKATATITFGDAVRNNGPDGPNFAVGEKLTIDGKEYEFVEKGQITDATKQVEIGTVIDDTLTNLEKVLNQQHQTLTAANGSQGTWKLVKDQGNDATLTWTEDTASTTTDMATAFTDASIQKGYVGIPKPTTATGMPDTGVIASKTNGSEKAAVVEFDLTKLEAAGANFKDGDKLTINGTEYTFKTTPTGAANEIAIGANFATTMGTVATTLGTFVSGTAGNATVNGTWAYAGGKLTFTADAGEEGKAVDMSKLGISGYQSGGAAKVGEVDFKAQEGSDGTTANINRDNAFSNDIPDAADAPTNLGEVNEGIVFQIGANGTADQRVSLHIEDMSTKGLNVGAVSVATRTEANDAIDVVDAAIDYVSKARANLGAMQNRLEHTINNLGVNSENLSAAESRIRDVDMAKEMMEFTKNNILTQAAQAMLAQANQQPQGVLQLLQ